MVSKQISLCNAALMLIGSDRISSFNEDSLEAITCNEFYERSYRALLMSYPFKFALKTQELAIDQLAPPLDDFFPHAYKLPTDFIWLQHLLPEQSNWKIQENIIYVPERPTKAMRVKYIFRVDEERMTAIYEQAFMYYLASQICLTLTEDTNKNIAMYRQYQDHHKRAKSLDAQQQPSEPFRDFPLDSSRYGS